MYSLDDCFLVLRYSYLRWGCGPSLVKVLLVSWIKNSQLRTIVTSHRKSQTSPPLHAFVRNLGSNVKSHHDDKPDMFGSGPTVALADALIATFCVFLSFGWSWITRRCRVGHDPSWYISSHFWRKRESCPERCFGRWATRKIVWWESLRYLSCWECWIIQELYISSNLSWFKYEMVNSSIDLMFGPVI